MGELARGIRPTETLTLRNRILSNTLDAIIIFNLQKFLMIQYSSCYKTPEATQGYILRRLKHIFWAFYCQG